ncbi:MAG: radical SAM protein [Candidatus Omnitrophica bacterium]|nr:radical SAM protein [Candidatus Omnitrophota bacterium]
MKGKVLLVNPHPEEVAQTKYHSMPVLGIGYLASALMRDGFECRIADGKMEGLTRREIVDRASDFRPDILGISSMTHDILRARALAEDIKREIPGVTVLLGGPHATALPEQTLNDFPCFDILVLGEGEITVVELANFLQTGDEGEDPEIDGIAFRKEGKPHIRPVRGFVEDLDSIAPPAWELFPPTKHYAVYTSRGCPFGCNFCVRVLGNKVRYRSPGNVIEELEQIVARGGEYVFFRDETFTANRKHFTEICETMISRGISKKISWGCTTHCSTVNRDVLGLMKRAGCVSVEYGIESGNDEILKRMGKRLTKDTARRAVKAAKEAGIETFGNFIFGHPYETKETIQQTIDFATELNTTQVSFGAMVPYPGTGIYRMAKSGQGGYKNMSFDWGSFDKYQGGAIELESVTREDLAKAQMKAFATFYFRNMRLGSAWKFFWENKRNIIFYLARLLKGGRRAGGEKAGDA